MRKTMIALTAGLILSLQTVYAGELDELLIVADAYTSLGDDNNYLDSVILSAQEFEIHKSDATKISVDADGNHAALANALAQCVFMKEGAYGAHFSDELGQRVVNGFYGKMRYGTDFLSKASLYQLDGKAMKIATGIFNAPCALAIEFDQRVLVMQAAAMD